MELVILTSVFRYFILCCVLLVGCVCPFNVDTSVPKSWNGDAASFFSYSLAFFKSRDSQIKLLSSSPNKVTTNGQTSIHTCALNLKKCQEEFFDSEAHESLDWMGASLATTSADAEKSKILVCSHRYYIPGEHEHNVAGSCYLMDNSVMVEKVLKPCEKANCQAGSSSAFSDDLQILIGGPGQDLGVGAAYSYSANSFDKSTTIKKSDDYDYLQAGDSVNIGRLINNSTTYIVGASNYEGRVYLYSPTNSSQPYIILTGQQYFSRFGFQTALGDFNQDGYEDLVVSAPYDYQDNYHGAVYLFNNGPGGLKSGMKGKKLTGKKCSKSELCREARFGFSIASVGDLDLDGYPDLVVGAPFEGKGVVYVFSGSADSLSEHYSQRIEASQVDASLTYPSFGYSLTKRSTDADKNLYPDFVVGSYLNGKAFLLRTRPVVQAKVKFEASVKTLNPKEGNCHIAGHTFCFNLTVCSRLRIIEASSKLHVLHMNYTLQINNPSDLSRASFRSNHAQDTITIISLIQPIFTNDKNYNRDRINHGDDEDDDDDGVANVCHNIPVFIMENNRDFLNPIDISMRINLTNIARPTPRITPNVFEHLVSLSSYPVLRKDVTDTVYRKKVHFQSKCGDDNKCESDLIIDLIPPMESIKASAALGIKVRVVNNGEEAHLTQLFVTTPPNVFFANVSMQSIPISCSPSHNKTLVCDVGNPVLARQAVTFTLNFDLRKVTNDQTVANFTFLVNTTSIELTPEDNKATVIYDIKTEADLLLTSQSTPSSLYYSRQSSSSLKQAVQRFNQLSTKNKNNNSNNMNNNHNINNNKFLGPRLQHVFEVKNIGRGLFAESELLVEWPHALGPYPLLYFIRPDAVSVTGGSCTYDQLLLNPYKLQDTRASEDEGRFQRHSNNNNNNNNMNNNNDDIISSINVDSNANHFNVISRTKRSSSSSSSSSSWFYPSSWFSSSSELSSSPPSSSASLLEFSSAIQTLSCADSRMKCSKIRCSIEALETGESAVVVVRSIFWNSTFQMMAPDTDRVSLMIESHLDLLPSVRQANHSNDHFKTYTLLLREELQDERIPWWVYLLAVLAALLLLLLFILLLWKCGFFRRTPYDKEQKYSVTLTTKDEVEKQTLNKR